jgi:hypothetical protein
VLSPPNYSVSSLFLSSCTILSFLFLPCRRYPIFLYFTILRHTIMFFCLASSSTILLYHSAISSTLIFYRHLERSGVLYFALPHTLIRSILLYHPTCFPYLKLYASPLHHSIMFSSWLFSLHPHNLALAAASIISVATIISALLPTSATPQHSIFKLYHTRCSLLSATKLYAQTLFKCCYILSPNPKQLYAPASPQYPTSQHTALYLFLRYAPKP